MNGKVGPWVRVGVPANALERWRHGAAEHLRPLAQAARHAGGVVRRGPGGYIRTPPPARLSSSARSARSAMARTQTRTRRRFKRRGGRRRMYRVRQVTPKTCARWLHTSKYLSLNPAAGTLVAEALNLNGAQDPLGSGSATQQPLGFDQYELLYRRYCVVAWRITCEIVSTDNTNPLVVGFSPKTDSTGLTSYLHYKEFPGAVQRVITPDVDKVFFKSRGGVRKWLLPTGGKLLSNPDLSSLCTTVPSRILYGHLYAQSMDGSADPAAVHITVKLSQLIVFFDPVVPSRSTQ